MIYIYLGLFLIWLGGLTTGVLIGSAVQVKHDNKTRAQRLSDMYPRRGPDDNAS